MRIEKTLYTEKAKAWKELTETVWAGKEITFYHGIGIVNFKDNETFLNALDKIQENNYIEDVSETQFARKNKLMDKMTIAQIKAETHKYQQLQNVYQQMHDSARKALATGVMINHYEKHIKKYELKFESTKDAIYLDAVNRLKKDIENLYIKLVA